MHRAAILQVAHHRHVQPVERTQVAAGGAFALDGV